MKTKMNEINLDKEEMLDLLRGVRGIYALAGIDQYSTMSEAPKFQTDPIYLYLSKVLDLDFKEDVYGNRLVNAMNKEFKEEVSRYNKIQEENGTYQHLWWWIGDSLTQILCNHVNNDEPITEEFKEALDAKLKKYYNDVMDIINVYTYVPAEKINGEQLYRRRR